ncbi:MAG: ParB-like nuclease domain-containing protein [Selenomonadaceae bacterium]|nr:ParB-like nuclease domain-containing protein [Selenomonadaceae bacterium]
MLLSEIDPKAINLIREIKKKNNSDYKQLKNAIEKDGQQQPIIVRELNDEEKAKLTKGKAKKIKYGIIDGHHRYMIAEEMKKDKISAVIDKGESSPIRDSILAMRFNESSIKMTSLQKGKVIYDLLKSMDISNKEIIKEIGLQLFGLKAAMTYRCLQKYKISIGEETIEKPRENIFNKSEMDKIYNLLPKDLENLSSISAEEGLKQLENIKLIEQQLKYLKKAISSLEQVKDDIKLKKQENVKMARERKSVKANDLKN